MLTCPYNTFTLTGLSNNHNIKLFMVILQFDSRNVYSCFLFFFFPGDDLFCDISVHTQCIFKDSY